MAFWGIFRFDSNYGVVLVTEVWAWMLRLRVKEGTVKTRKPLSPREPL